MLCDGGLFISTLIKFTKLIIPANTSSPLENFFGIDSPEIN